MKLADILPADAQIEAGSAALEVGGLSTDSRAIKRGDVFVAIAGGKADGAKFIAAAVAAGAVAVVAQTSQTHDAARWNYCRAGRKQPARRRADGG